MAGPLDNLLGIHGTALSLHRARMDQIASNIANADTPGYLARDLDFGAVLKAQAGAKDAGVALARTAAGHLAGPDRDGPGGAAQVYRIPLQPAQDGNTVELATENAKFSEAAMRYQATLTFVERRMSSLKTAITGGE
jgi:flagellar basal-body rod protein FlgB